MENRGGISMDRQRLFVAVALPEPVREELRAWCAHAKGNVAFQKWVHPDDWHITLKFLGDTSVENLSEIKRLLGEVAYRVGAFELALKGVGWFGPPNSPSILWAGVQDHNRRLEELHKQVDRVMGQLGFPAETRPYHPHVTLARRYQGIQPFAKDRLPSLFARQPGGSMHWQVREFVLYASHLGRTPMYEPLETFRLQPVGI